MPITTLTPVGELGAFKATPVCGVTMAETIASGKAAEMITPYALSRFWEMDLVGKKAPPPSDTKMKLIPCPMNGPKPENEFVFGGEIKRCRRLPRMTKTGPNIFSFPTTSPPMYGNGGVTRLPVIGLSLVATP